MPLVQADSSSIEGVLVGYFMGDRQFIRLAKQSLHGYAVCKHMGWEFTPENVERAKTEQKDLYDKFKTVNYLCLTPDHEVLTPDGWRPIEDVREFDTVMQWAPDGTMSWASARNRQAIWLDGESLVEIHGRALSARMTTNHRVPYRTSSSEAYRVKTAGELPSTARIPTTGVSVNGFEENPAQVRLAVAAQADGHFTPQGHTRWTLRKPRKIARLLELLDAAGLTPRIAQSGGNTVIEVKNWRPPLLTAERDFDMGACLQLDAEARQVLLDEVPHWDGHMKGPYVSYTTTRRVNAEVLQAIAHITGRQALLRTRKVAHVSTGEVVTLSFNARQDGRFFHGNKSGERYTGWVHTMEVPTGFYMIRRQGRVSITGNSAYGGTPYMMWMNNPEIFPTLASAKAAQEGFFAVFPGVRQWQEDVRARAKREGYLQNPWGGRHYFYEVQTWQYDDEGNLVRDEYTGKPKVKLGADAKRVVAFLPQSSAGMFMRDNLRIIGRSEWAQYMPANVTVHDGYVLDVPWQLVDEAAEFLVSVLTRPVPQLGGLRIGCEVEVGQNWLDMTKIGSYPMLDDDALPMAA